MEVDAVSFPSHLLDILGAISEAEFVSIDLELSGIASKKPDRGQKKQTLEERYAELKQCAETYQILQVGFTCVKHDILTDHYVFRPYNINISPLIDEKLDIERIFSFQSGAVEFLLQHGFQIGLPFTNGVQYLSRDEAKLAKRLAWNRLEKKNIFQDLQLEDDAHESLDFCARVRTAILAWVPEVKETLTIHSDIGKDNDTEYMELSRFQKRLVHQLVRAEFPNLVTLSRSNCIILKPFNAEREASVLEKRKRQVKETIIRQTGFRWIIEALAKGDITGIPPTYFAVNREGNAICANMYDIEQRYKTIAGRLKRHQPALVGHNCFTDLVYLYSGFIGKLPDTVDEFREAIHKVFPMIIDTKYLATHNCGDINPASSLQEIAATLSGQPLPVISVHPAYEKYNDAEIHHEAGYDSLQTAAIMVRLSANLKVKGGYLDTVQGSEEESVLADPFTRDPMALIPAIDAMYLDFWRLHGNKLRVFGTEEGIFMLEK